MIRPIATALARILIGFFLIRGGYALLGQWLQFGTTWSLTTLALCGSLAAETIFQLSRYEQTVVASRRGRILLALRWSALAGLLWMLSQPVWSRMVKKEIKQEVIIVIDDSASMHLTDDGQSNTRQEIAIQALEASGLSKQLEGKMRVRTLRAARKVLGNDEQAIEGWNQATDLAGALDTVLDQVPADQLGGVVLLSDGRHNRPGRVEDIARRFGILDAPIGVLAVGDDAPPRDAAILSIQSPDAVHLGDRIRIQARLKFDGYKGKKTSVRLYQGETLLEERPVSIPQDSHREEIRFRHTPDQQGITSYRLELAALPDERFSDNNRWAFETSVTDARTNVLILESHPRWEFRYLRNLFYGRDKSIHLQYVLMNPDRISGQEDQAVHASAARPFGQAQANRLPKDEQAWRSFDVIILGDLHPDSLNTDQWKILEQCVQQRGTMLITIAGPRWMPHAHQNPSLERLLPILYTPSQRSYFHTRQSEFQIHLASAGQSHPISAQSDSRLENASIWSQFPRLRWRHPLAGVKKGAEVLLMAGPSQTQAQTAPNSAKQLDKALEALKRKRAIESNNALLVTQTYGKGKVATLLTDRIWRLREGVGDQHHHRFWGQLIRWGAGPNLRSGTPEVRLGTDQLTYSGDDPIQIMVRLRDKQRNPIKDPGLKAHIWKLRKKVATVPLSYVEESHGLHQATAPALATPGSYHITLESEKLDPKLTGNRLSSVRTVIRVVGSTSPVELSETTLNRPLMEKVAELSGGQFTTPDDASTLPSLFLTGDESREELRETSLWDHWLLLTLLLIIFTTEWSLRRKLGLP
ncbi:hypothetical protein HW115_08920 [Verrucomicrobiaceae bacterium N1E253]|uniref:VWFA domain-containing protein n=1 Tax=Oceaniferula marina TaxID=2748318 RepID=A0A851GLS8_9BACT|nr:hypothetical protein [Oceaniferula marina]NWK55730.1 hypothetical protein [Oceaniferula marina]